MGIAGERKLGFEGKSYNFQFPESSGNFFYASVVSSCHLPGFSKGCGFPDKIEVFWVTSMTLW